MWSLKLCFFEDVLDVSRAEEENYQNYIRSKVEQLRSNTELVLYELTQNVERVRLEAAEVASTQINQTITITLTAFALSLALGIGMLVTISQLLKRSIKETVQFSEKNIAR